MHFAQTLDAGIIPEWKDVYVNYRQGKRLIQKLEHPAAPDASQDWDLPPPAIPSDPPPTNHLGPTVSLQKPTTSRKSPEVVNSKVQASASAPVNERSPLIETPGGSHRLYRTPAEPSGGPTPTQNNAQPLSKSSARKVFYSWLNGEVKKANEFYAEKEKEAATKDRLLQYQFQYFDEQRAEHRRVKAQARNKGASFIDKLDLPTMPLALRGLKRSSLPTPTMQLAHATDFNNKDDHVGYYQAKTMLKTATNDYYQMLLQLNGFRALNDTAVRKIVKKFDKQMNTSTLDRYLDETKNLEIRSARRVEDMISKVEKVYAEQFTHGNHKLAVDRLRASTLSTEEPHSLSILTSGIFFGAAVPLLAYGFYTALVRRKYHAGEIHYLLQVWGGFVIVSGFILATSLCVAVWQHYKINYTFIFDLDRSTMMDYRQYPVMPALLFFGVTLFGWLSFVTTQSFRVYYPCLFLGISVFCLIAPVKWFKSTRKWFLHALWRLVLSGLYSVEFRDLVFGDIFCSMTYPMSNIEFFFCLYSTSGWWTSPGYEHAQRCTSRHSRAAGFLQCLPGIWRFFQCWRRYADTYDWFPHLLNAGKYTFTILYYMSLSLARISPHDGGMRAMFIVFALINGVYTSIWDVLMDFSLTPAWRPRHVLVYPRWTYFAVMILDPILRQQWILYVVFWDLKEQGAKISFIVAMIEAIRRVIWIGFRVENEHAANVSRCRAFKDLTLPYDDVKAASAEYDIEASASSRPPLRTGTFPGTGTPQTSSYVGSPSSLGVMTPRIRFAHTNDFQRRQHKHSDK